MAESSGNTSRSFDLSFPGDARFVKVARRFVVAICRLSGMSDRKRDEVGLAITELLNNSVEHGSTGSAQIDLSIRLASDRVVIRVHDEGNRPLDEETLDQALTKGPGKPDDTQFRGRGLFLVQALMDEFHVVNAGGHGTTLEVVKLR